MKNPALKRIQQGREGTGLEDSEEGRGLTREAGRGELHGSRGERVLGHRERGFNERPDVSECDGVEHEEGHGSGGNAATDSPS